MSTRMCRSHCLAPLVAVALTALRRFALAEESGCDLECQHNGVCAPGPADCSIHIGNGLSWTEFTQSPNGYHCECTENWTGLNCDISYRECFDQNQHICYHGSQCVEDDFLIDGSVRFGCDCNTISGDVKYVGAHCGSQQTSPDCLESTEEVEGVSWFCVNGGKCGDPNERNINNKCNCGDDFEGPHCEFPVGEVPVCYLRCENFGQCRFGIKDMTIYHPVSVPYLQTNHYDFMHCVCPEGFTGVTCDIPVEKCHEDFCFHGGTCHEARHSTSDELINFCDCSTASLLSDNIVFAGKSCEYIEKKDVGVCPGTFDEDAHCFHNGICRSDGGCDCIDIFLGPECAHTEDTFTPCDLECLNGGECRAGFKDYAPFRKFDDLPFTSETHSNFQYCVCPEGYTGLQCEIQVSKCSGDDHICLNGGSCREEASSFCDCSTATFPVAAGAYCQHIATQYCVVDAVADQFCTNGGTCLSLVREGDRHPGCLCDKAFVGDRCEIPLGGDDGCKDQEDVEVTFLKKVKGLKVTCEDIAASRDKDLFCGAFSKWRKACRVTCGTCREKDDPCMDKKSKSFAAYRTRKKDCAWLREVSTRKRNKLCNSPSALERCPRSCGVCR